jgi:hypothetical protein
MNFAKLNKGESIFKEDSVLQVLFAAVVHLDEGLKS